MLRLSDNPPGRWPLDRPLLDDLGHWCVARVKPRQEKALAHDLVRLGMAYYLPMMTKRTVRRDNGKPRKSVVVLFPGYISVAGNGELRSELMKTGRTAGVIAVADQERFVSELGGVQRALDSNLAADTHPLMAGQRVRIVAGPLLGQEGVVENCGRPGRRVYINVEMFNRSVAVTVSPEEVVAI
ncbi:MAG TPA: transcription termination/antitermination NusG family protein [bacterium]|nr:transcription termination/antitermination NusG family protein [bacterium]